MADTDEHQLFADPFSIEDQPELAGFHCGDSGWSRAASEWIKGSEVCDSIEKNNTKVWIFRDRQDAIVGLVRLMKLAGNAGHHQMVQKGDCCTYHSLG